MDDLLVEFLTETTESLDHLDIELVKLEQDPNDPGLLGNIFRLVHTIKGTCGFLGLPRLESVAHAGENILGKFRDGALTVNPDGVTLILECLDQIKELLSELERTEAEPEGDDQPLIDRLNGYADSGELLDQSSPAEAPADPVDLEAANGEADEHGFVPVPAAQTGADAESGGDDPALDEHGFVPVPASETGAGQTEAAAADTAPPTPTPATKSESESSSSESSVANQSIRVNVESDQFRTQNWLNRSGSKEASHG